MGKDKTTIDAYLDNLEASDMTWIWTLGYRHDVHGDGKSRTGGKFRMYTLQGNDGLWRVYILRFPFSKNDKVLEVEFDHEPQGFDEVVCHECQTCQAVAGVRRPIRTFLSLSAKSFRPLIRNNMCSPYCSEVPYVLILDLSSGADSMPGSI